MRINIRCLHGMLLAICMQSMTKTINQSITTSKIPMTKTETPAHQSIISKKLNNGMTVLVRPVHTLPKVSIQLWYNVGSRDETDKERGIAHLIEHMIFKGTEKLSESDINVITHMLSGSCNAFTSYDYTGYLFNLPSHHWQQALEIMSDCMANCTFKPDMLSSEMKAVIQELKMYRDMYTRGLFDELIGTIFADHPYHHPIIGYKQDLWNASSDLLRAFYKKHYIPNNATLIVVGDVDPQEVFLLAQKTFGSLKANPTYKKSEPYHNRDIASRSVTLFRDIKQPIKAFCFVVPGTKDKKDYALQTLAWVLGKGKSSRLYQRIVEDLQIATSIDAGYEDLFDYGLFLILCEPKSPEVIPQIRNEIIQALTDLANNGITPEELTKASKYTKMSVFHLLEDTEHQAYEIGKYFVATQDPDYAFTFIQQNPKELKVEAEQLAKEFLRSSVMHEGAIMPLAESEHDAWQKLQAESDKEDAAILAKHVRTSPVEPARYAKNIAIKKPKPFNFPKAATSSLPNGLKVFAFQNKNTPTISITLDLKADYIYDPEDKQGLCHFMSNLLTEGTKKYSAREFSQVLESRGISLSVSMGTITLSLLAEDLDFALSMVKEILTQALFDEKEIEKVRAQILTQIKHFWDDPRSCAGQLTKEHIYKGHPYARQRIGTTESIESITRKDLVEFYQRLSTPYGSRISIVGDIKPEDARTAIEKHLGSWHGPHIAPIAFPVLQPTLGVSRIDHYLNRDQIVLTFARLSVDRRHPDYDRLLLFDQILSGGALGSMSSRLFRLREQSGLFYTISGSTISGADEQPGLFVIRTIVSVDRLAEAEQAIRETLDTIIDSITQEELDEAKRAVAQAIINNFESNNDIANVFLFLDRFNLPFDYFDNRAATLDKITLQDMKESARKIVNTVDLVTLCVGRVGEKPIKKKPLTVTT